MHRFSIIVPMLDDRRLFDDTLASTLRYRPDSCEIIVVHDGTYDDPFELHGEIEFVSTSGSSNLIDMFNAAVIKASGEYIALLQPGVELTSDWDQTIDSEFADRQVASVCPMLVWSARPQTMMAAGVAVNSGFRRQIVGFKTKISTRTMRRIAPLGPTSWAAFYRRSALDQIGRLAEQLDPDYLDVDIAISLDRIGFKSVFCPGCIINVEQTSLIERQLTQPHGASAQRAFRRYAALSESTPSLFDTARTVAGEVLLSPFQPWKLRHAAQRLGAWKKARLDREYAQHLSDLADEFRQRELSEMSVEPAPQHLGSINSRFSRRAA